MRWMQRFGLLRNAAGGDSTTPSDLLGQYTLLSVLAAVAILILASVSIFGVINGELQQSAENTSIHFGQSIFEQERTNLVSADGSILPLAIGGPEFAAFDSRMKRYLSSFEMHKIKVLSPDATVIYSTDTALIGTQERLNERLRLAIESGQVVSDIEQIDELVGFDGSIHTNVEIVEAYVPIHVNGRRVGAFEVYVDTTSTRDRIRSATKWVMITLIVVLAAIFVPLYLIMRKGMIRLARAERKQRRLATRDMLTGLYNRHYLIEHLGEERERMIRASNEGQRTDIAILMADLDLFKSINDQYGHLVGDRILREVAWRMKGQLRPYDLIGRFGGEEFLCILPDSDLAEGMAVAERLREAVASTPITCGTHLINLTISIGAAASCRPDEDSDDIIHRADLAMYHAKHTGRNRVQCIDQGQVFDDPGKQSAHASPEEPHHADASSSEKPLVAPSS